MAALDDNHSFRTAESTPTVEVHTEQYMIRRDTTDDHPLKSVDADEIEALTKYAMMPKGVALAAFSRPSMDAQSKMHDGDGDGLDLRKREDSTISLESLDLELPSLEAYKVETVSFPKSPQELRQTLEASGVPLPLEYSSPMSGSEISVLLDKDEDEEDRSMYQAYLSPDCNNVQLKKDPLYQGSGPSPGSSLSRRRKIRVTADVLSSIATDTDTATDTTITEQMYTARDSSASPGGSDTELDDTFMPEMDSPDELEDSILECLDNAEITTPEVIPEFTAVEERNESRHWRSVTVAGEERRIDMKVIEPYKRVLSHGGYLSAGCHNAIIVFSACFLPDRSRVDYDYVMDNLFLYVLTTLDQLITEDYVLIFLHGATRRSVIPTFAWIKRCYQLIDRRLRKTLQGLYIVHPTFWLKTLVVMTRPFISSKFSRKLRFVNSLDELYDLLPLEHASIPDKVKKYDEIKRSMRPSSTLS